MLNALIIETYNLHDITKDTVAPVYSSLCASFFSFTSFLLFMSSCWRRSLAFFLSQSFHVGHDPKEKLTLEPKGEIFWVSASVPANDKDYFGDLPLPLWWIMPQRAVMSQQNKWKNGTSTCFYDLDTVTFNSLGWDVVKVNYSLFLWGNLQ